MKACAELVLGAISLKKGGGNKHSSTKTHWALCSGDWPFFGISCLAILTYYSENTLLPPCTIIFGLCIGSLTASHNGAVFPRKCMNSFN